MRQYIGARYMPRFVGTYNATTIYEALDVVDDGLGTTYVAKIPTPAGTPLTNTTYWSVYGASSGAILDLQNRMQTAENDIVDLQTEAANKNIFEYKVNDNIIVIGDSWTAGLHATHGLWHWLNIQLPHDEFYHAQESGAGFVAVGAGGNTFLTLLQGVSVTDPDNIQHIIVLGGINDQGLSGIGTQVAAFLSYCHTMFPNAAIDVIAVNRTQYGALNRYDYVNVYSAYTADDTKARFFNLTHKINARYWYNTSHLDETGYELMARVVSNTLLGGSASVFNTVNSVTATDSTNTINATIYQTQATDGSIKIQLNSAINASGSFALGGLIKALKLTLSGNLNGQGDNFFNGNAYVTDINGSRYIPIMMYLSASNELTLTWIDSNGSNPYTSLYISPFTLDFGMMY